MQIASGRVVLAILQAFLVVMWGCGGGTTTSPSTNPGVADTFPLAPGNHVLTATGIVCATSGILGSFVSYVTLSREGQEWVARSTPQNDGDVEFRFREAGVFFGDIRISGGARGTAFDARTGDYSLRFGPSDGVAISGTTSTVFGPSVSGGLEAGTATFTSRLGTTACSQILWGIRPPQGCEINRSC